VSNNMRNVCITLVVAALLVAVLAPIAHADCNVTSYTWPFCHIPKPSIPRINVGGGRPPLTPKNSAWCTQSYIELNGGRIVWTLSRRWKVDRQWGLDYYHNEFIGYQWNGRTWVKSPEIVSVDCDA
jgi:hypothetical protein